MKLIGWLLLPLLAGCISEQGLQCQPSINTDISRATGINSIAIQEQCST